MEKSVKITLMIVSTVIVLALIGVFAAMQLSPVSGHTINVNGNAQIEATPDIVSVYFNVQTRGTTAEEAKNKNSDIVDSVITNLVKLGFERKEITTQDYNIYPDYQWINNQRQDNGYVATHSIRLEMPTSDSGKIGSAIDAGVNAGAGISYINFELSPAKQNEYKAQALRLATEDARIKAESIASGLGKRLGSIQSVSDSGFNYNPWQLYANSDVAMSGAAEAKAAATSIQPGDKTISAQVTVVYKI